MPLNKAMEAGDDELDTTDKLVVSHDIAQPAGLPGAGFRRREG